MKHLNFRQFNTNSKNFFETINFFQKEAKTAPKRPILFCPANTKHYGEITLNPKPHSDPNDKVMKIVRKCLKSGQLLKSRNSIKGCESFSCLPVDCKTVGFFSKSVYSRVRRQRESPPVSLSVFSFCLTVRAYLNLRKNTDCFAV